MPRPRKPQAQEQQQTPHLRLQPVRPDALNGRIPVSTVPPFAYVLQYFDAHRCVWLDIPTSEAA